MLNLAMVSTALAFDLIVSLMMLWVLVSIKGSKFSNTSIKIFR